jgi:hypothetical protein
MLKTVFVHDFDNCNSYTFSVFCITTIYCLTSQPFLSFQISVADSQCLPINDLIWIITKYQHTYRWYCCFCYIYIQHYIHEGVKIILDLWNACTIQLRIFYFSISHLKPQRLKHRTIILLFYMSVKLGFSPSWENTN